MGTSTILGDTYQTVIMPDGNEWLAENYRAIGLVGRGAWGGDGTSNDGDGRYFYRGAANDEVAALPDGWRLPTLAEWRALQTALGGASVAGGPIKTAGTTYWNSPNTGATNSTGFSLRGAGYYQVLGDSWTGKKNSGFYWASDLESDGLGNFFCFAYCTSTSEALLIGATAAPDLFRFPMRLMRTYTPPPINAEAHETTHALALEWTEAADGTPVAYDDGSAYDYIESTITARMTPDELTALETAWQSSTKLYTIYSTGYLLGPLIDMSAGVEVRLMSYQVDQSADSAMTLYDVTIGVHYGPLSAPSAGSLAVVQTRGRPYHSVAPGAASWITEGGTSDVNAYGRASERSCTWYTHSLTTAQAADVVNALRTLRGSSTTWTAGGVATPWGPGESGTATVWIPEWSVHRESNLLWGVQMELVRNG